MDLLEQYVVPLLPESINNWLTGQTTPTLSPVHVAKLFVYPVKSCRGISVEEAQVTKTGFLHDRHWVITDEDYIIMTQRTESRLVLLQPTIHEHPKDPDTGLPTVPYLAVNVVEQQGPGLPPSTSQNELRVPLYPTDEERARYKLVHVTVFSEKVAGYDLGDEVAEWCSQFLGKPARLVMRADTEVRRMLVCAPPDDLVEEPSQTAFADDAPFLLASEASLHDVNEHLPGYSIDIRRFRPNILVSGCQAFEEETWKRVQFIPDADREAAPETRQADLWVTSRCTRCVMTNNNPDTGMPSSEQQPLKTIIAYRRVDPGAKFKGCFGMNCAPVKLDQMIRVGDAVIVQETGDHCRTSD